MSCGGSAGLHGWRRPVCAHMDASGAVSASSEAAPASRSAITHHKASAPGSACGVRACEHALLAWLLKDTGCQHGGPAGSVSRTLMVENNNESNDRSKKNPSTAPSQPPRLAY